jgi:2-polyprenyl-3-methyl-5-hydroxy-6-metoxy-1,4-benzoquinol methylase
MSLNSTMNNQILSPVSGGKTERVGAIKTEMLIKAYSSSFGIDVSKFFTGLNEIQILKCLDTGYKFYFPFNVRGDEGLYNALAKNQWYYSENKWEFYNCLKYFKNKKEILEIGCGNGAFIKIVQEKLNIKISGIELSESAYRSSINAGLDVHKETIQEHKKRSNKKYDIVCSFQVLEHISEVKDFLNDMIEVLSSKGLLIITLPNNNSFMFKNFHNLLNFPPHHMGIWSPKSISKIENFYPLRKIQIDFEPINKDQLNLLIDIIYQNVTNSNSLIRFIFFKLRIINVIKVLLVKFPFLVKSHSMTVVFQKVDL